MKWVGEGKVRAVKLLNGDWQINGGKEEAGRMLNLFGA
jgi:hypothetical protein